MKNPFKRKFFGRIVCFSLLCAVFGLQLFLQHRSHQVESELHLKLDLNIKHGGHFKVFYDVGAGFNEEDSAYTYFNRGTGYRRLLTPLPDKKIWGLRIDPTDNLSTYSFRNLEIVGGSGNTIKSIDIGSLEASDDAYQYQSDGTTLSSIEQPSSGDPGFYVFFDVPLFQTKKTLNDSFLKVLSDCWFPFCVVIILTLARTVFFFYGLLALAYWQVFYPGFYSPDSIDQLIQATIGKYWNQHPPIMAYLIGCWFKLGLGIEDLIFSQGVLGLFGIRYLSISTQRILVEKFVEYRAASEGVVLALAVLLMSPFSPLPFYLNTLWKDTWGAIIFLWLIGALVNLANCLGKKPIKAVTLLGVFCLMLLMILTRYNAVLISPIFATLLGCFSSHRSLWKSFLVGVLALGCFVFAKPFLHKILDVWEAPIENQMITLDLLGIYYLYPELEDEMPYTASEVKEDWRERFLWANIYPISFNADKIVSDEYGSYVVENEKLKEEYYYIVRNHPLKLTRVKFAHFSHLLGWSYTHYWYHSYIAKNDFGLAHSVAYKPAIRTLNELSYEISKTGLRWFFGVHLIWLVANILITLVLFFNLIKRRGLSGLIFTLISMVPLFYYMSYTVAAPARDFRYMFPSSLVLETFVLSALVVLLMRFLKFGGGRPIVGTESDSD